MCQFPVCFRIEPTQDPAVRSHLRPPRCRDAHDQRQQPPESAGLTFTCQLVFGQRDGALMAARAQHIMDIARVHRHLNSSGSCVLGCEQQTLYNHVSIQRTEQFVHIIHHFSGRDLVNRKFQVTL